MKVKNTKIYYFLLVTVTIVIFYFLLKDIGIKKIFEELSKANLILIFLAFLFSLGFVILSGQKLKMFVEMMGYKIGLPRCQKITIATYTLNVMIPSKGGDFIKAFSLRDILPISQGIGIVILERLIDLFILCLIVLIGSVLLNNQELMLISSSMLLLFMISIIIMIKLSNLHMRNNFLKKLNDIGCVAKSLFNNKKYTLFIALIGAIIWFGSAFQAYILYRALGVNIPFVYTIEVMPIVIFVGFIPITIAGMGTREAALIYFFSTYASDSTNITVGLLFCLLRYWVLALLGIPFIGHLKGYSISPPD